LVFCRVRRAAAQDWIVELTMPRLQFSLRTMLSLMACATCFGAGMVAQTRVFERERRSLYLQEQHLIERDFEINDRESKLPYGGIKGGSNLCPEICPMCGRPTGP
jgi:hypothetical protein